MNWECVGQTVCKNKWVHASNGGQRHSISPEMTDSPIFWEPEYIFVRLQPPTSQTKHTKYELNSDHVADISDSPQSIIHKDLSTFISFIHSVFCLTSGPKPPPKRFLHIVQSRASSFKWEYPLLSLRSSSSFLRLLPRRLATSISPFIFPSITCFRRQFLRKMWPIQLAFRFVHINTSLNRPFTLLRQFLPFLNRIGEFVDPKM